jgi:hypothetical protein
MASLDPEQVRLRDITLDSLRAEERGHPVLAATACGLLLTTEREWREALLWVNRCAGALSNSRLPAAVDLLAAAPFLSVSALADALGCSVEGAARMLESLVQLEVAARVTGRTGRGARRFYDLKRLLPTWAETTASRHPAQGGQWGGRIGSSPPPLPNWRMIPRRQRGHWTLILSNRCASRR